MKNSSKTDGISMLNTNCDWILWQARELQALFSHDSNEMIKLNRVRALSDIESIRASLSETENDCDCDAEFNLYDDNEMSVSEFMNWFKEE